MTPTRLSVSALLALALAALAGCGAGTGPASSASASVGGAAVSGAPATAAPATAAAATAAAVPTPGSASPVAASITATADARAGVIDVVATVTGPAQLFGGCEPTLTVVLIDPAGTPVPRSTPPAVARCLAITDITVEAGQTQAFRATVPLPAGHGTYMLRATLAGAGDLASVPVNV